MLGVGACGLVMAARSWVTMSVSESASKADKRSNGSMRVGANPSILMVARSQPLPLM